MIEQLDIILKTSPLTTAAYSDLVLLRARANEYDAARAAYQKARERNVSGPKLEWGHAMILLGEGRLDEARGVLRSVGGVYGGIGRLYLAVADILEGKLEAASKQLQVDLVLDSTENNDLAEFTRRTLLARNLLLQERKIDAQKQVGAMLSLLSRQPPSVWQQERFAAGKLLVEAGDLARAKQLLRDSNSHVRAHSPRPVTPFWRERSPWPSRSLPKPRPCFLRPRPGIRWPSAHAAWRVRMQRRAIGRARVRPGPASPEPRETCCANILRTNGCRPP